MENMSTLGADGKMKTNCWIEDYNEWYYVKADGTRYESSWAKIGGSWYWFGGSGKMMSNGWLKLADGKWYYFRSGGQMAAGWIQDGGKLVLPDRVGCDGCKQMGLVRQLLVLSWFRRCDADQYDHP